MNYTKRTIKHASQQRVSHVYLLIIAPLLTVNVWAQPASNYEGVKFAMPNVALPFFADNKISIVEYGGVPDGTTSNTKAFADAIEALAKRGGGKLIIPKGIWLTGPIQLKSNINLHAEAGSLIIFSTNINEYPLIETSFEGLNTIRCISPIYGKDLINVAITGTGIFDGSGDAWRPVKKSKLTTDAWKKLLASGGVVNDAGNTWYPSVKSREAAKLTGNFNVPPFTKREEFEAVHEFLRPVLLSLVNCKNVLLDGPTFQNSPAWCLHPLMSEDVTLRNLTIRNPWYSQNGDGLDLESCKNVVIENCSFDVGDDAICFKSGKDKDGRDRGIPTENVIVKNCVVYHGHGGFVIGSEMSGGVKNVDISNCTFIGTDVGLRFKSTRGRGGVVENIYIRNIYMMDIPAEAILFDLYYGGNSPIPTSEETVADNKKEVASIPAATIETPSFKDIYMNDIVCRGAGRAIFLQGLPEMNLKNIHLTNVSITAQRGVEVIDATGIQFKEVHIAAAQGAALQLKNTKNSTVSGFSYQATEGVVVTGELTHQIQLQKADFYDQAKEIKVSDEVKKKSVVVK